MNYIQKRVLYYTTITAETLCKSYQDTFKKIAPIFHQENEKHLLDIVSNNTFLSLQSARSIDIHISYLISICKETFEFGKKKDEMDALYVKREAFQTLEILQKEKPISAITNLFEKEEDDDYPVLTVLLAIIQGHYDCNSVSALQKALKRGDLDAGIILLYYTEDIRELILAEMVKNRKFFIYPEIRDMLVRIYAFAPQQITNNLVKKENSHNE